MIAFADLSAVLAAFFVLILAMSDFDAPAIDRIAAVFGSDDGDWQVVRGSPAEPVPALARSTEDALSDRDYVAAVLSDRIDRADWPWRLQTRARGIAIAQAVPPGGVEIPQDMADYLAATGYRVRVVHVGGDAVLRRTAAIGPYDDGLRAAESVASVLAGFGVRGPIPVSARFAADGRPASIEIVLDLTEATD
jgi:hypothetical protein